MNTSTPFKWRHFQADIILLCVRWYLRYPTRLPRPGGDDARAGFTYRSHDDLPASVHCYAPELEKRCRPHLKTTNDSWRVDET
jgi:transposase, IS6 family